MIDYNTELLGERSKRRLTQDQLAALVGCFRATIVDIENGRVGIDKTTYDRFLQAMREQEQTQEQAA